MSSDLDSLAPGVRPTVAGHSRGPRDRGAGEALLPRPAPDGLCTLDAGCRQVNCAAGLE